MGVPSSQGKREHIRAANLLLSLSCSSPIIKKRRNNKRKNDNGMFECKTCNREFASFQALGGHSTSHLRPKIRYKEPAKTSHTCGICGKEFLMGQALGGHMRLHRSSPATSPQGQNGVGEEYDLSVLPVVADKKLGFHVDGDAINGEGFQVQLLNLFV